MHRQSLAFYCAMPNYHSTIGSRSKFNVQLPDSNIFGWKRCTAWPGLLLLIFCATWLFLCSWCILGPRKLFRLLTQLLLNQRHLQNYCWSLTPHKSFWRSIIQSRMAKTRPISLKLPPLSFHSQSEPEVFVFGRCYYHYRGYEDSWKTFYLQLTQSLEACRKFIRRTGYKSQYTRKFRLLPTGVLCSIALPYRLLRPSTWVERKNRLRFRD